MKAGCCTLMLLIGWLPACISTTAATVRPDGAEPQVIDVSGIESLIFGVSGDDLYVLGTDTGQCYAWKVDGANARSWKPSARWSDCEGLVVVDGLAQPILALLGKEVRLLALGDDWARIPLESQVPAVSSSNAWRILPAQAQTEDGLALMEAGDANANGVTGEWFLLQADAQSGWRALEIPGVSGPHRSFLRLGPGEIAVKGARKEGDVWTLASQGPDGHWSTVQPGEGSGVVQAVLSLNPGFAARIERPSGMLEWWVRSESGPWMPASTWFPDPPTSIQRIHAQGSVLVVSSNAIENIPQHSEYYWRGDSLPLKHVAELVSVPRERIVDAKSFMNSNGIAVLVEDRNGETMWHYSLRDPESGQWKPINELVPGAPQRIWDIADFASGLGLGVQGGADHDASAFEWTWLLPTEGGGWEDATRVLDLGSESIANIRSFEDGVMVAEVDGEARSHWYLPEQDRTWTRITQLTGMTAVSRANVLTARNRSDARLLAADDDSGRTHWFVALGASPWTRLDGLPRDETW